MRAETLEAIGRLGADPKSVDISVEIDRQTGRIRAIATGAAALRSTGETDTVSERQARRIAARSLHQSEDSIELAAETPGAFVYIRKPVRGIRCGSSTGAERCVCSAAMRPRSGPPSKTGTIDNDYRGIDFTFGYFTAVDFLGNEVRNLIADAEANRAYFLVEAMGRSAGWLAYGVAIAGEASLVISVEDIEGPYAASEESKNPKTGQVTKRKIMNIDNVIKRIVLTMVTREKEGKEYGVIVIAEGLAELLPETHLEGVGRDEHGHINISAIKLNAVFKDLITAEYKAQTGKSRKVTGLQLGYESRCAKPHAFDVMLGCQLGVGAYRALVENGHDGVMVSVSGQLQLRYVPFEELVDPSTLVTVVRHIETDSDFHKLTRFLEVYVNEEELTRRQIASHQRK